MGQMPAGSTSGGSWGRPRSTAALLTSRGGRCATARSGEFWPRTRRGLKLALLNRRCAVPVHRVGGDLLCSFSASSRRFSSAARWRLAISSRPVARFHPHMGVAREHGARNVAGNAHDHFVAGALFRYVERRVRDHAHDRSVAALQTNLASADTGGRQNLNGSSDLGSGRVARPDGILEC